MKIFMSLLAGLVFGLGLILSGMTDPMKVQGFLDITGQWDPSLALVMGGALLVSLIAFPYILRQPQSLLGEPLRVPTTSEIDKRLIMGSLTFGAGWGLAGYCPGPALTSLALGGLSPLLFCLGMLCGMAVFHLIESYRSLSP